jgi:AAA15 family ATPase/GTPase
LIGLAASGYRRITLNIGIGQNILVNKKGGNDYSQFHFGAGEASVIEMVTKIEATPDDSLIIIEEIENGLHPLATRKMVEYLFDVAQRKKCQIIFTTHAEAAI